MGRPRAVACKVQLWKELSNAKIAVAATKTAARRAEYAAYVFERTRVFLFVRHRTAPYEMSTV